MIGRNPRGVAKGVGKRIGLDLDVRSREPGPRGRYRGCGAVCGPSGASMRPTTGGQSGPSKGGIGSQNSVSSHGFGSLASPRPADGFRPGRPSEHSIAQPRRRSVSRVAPERVLSSINDLPPDLRQFQHVFVSASLFPGDSDGFGWVISAPRPVESLAPRRSIVMAGFGRRGDADGPAVATEASRRTSPDPWDTQVTIEVAGVDFGGGLHRRRRPPRGGNRGSIPH